MSTKPQQQEEELDTAATDEPREPDAKEASELTADREPDTK